jgi:hypothetical protein
MAARLETLEGRELLSHVGPIHHAALHSVATVGSFPPSYKPGPIHNEFGPGFAVKVPRFYSLFGGAIAGPSAFQSNVAAATARADGNGNLVLTGAIVDPLAIPPATPNTFWVWGINRGGATQPGPFPGRPKITFDALVIITQKTDGTLIGVVQDLKASTTTPFPVGSTLQVNQGTFKVILPLSLLPPTANVSVNQYRVNFWASDSPAVTNFRHVASFVPEASTFNVAGPHA